MSEYPKPWHNLDPEEWPHVEARIRRLISTYSENPRHQRRVKQLRLLLPAPFPAPKLETDFPRVGGRKRF